MTGAKVRATGANDINAATTGPGAKSASGNSAKVRATGANDINAVAISLRLHLVAFLVELKVVQPAYQGQREPRE